MEDNRDFAYLAMTTLIANPHYKTSPDWPEEICRPFRDEEASVLHHSLPEYRPTPLYALPGLAKKLGIGTIYVKDEAERFGLKAFKALGAAYAIFKFLSQHLRQMGRPVPAAQEFYRTPRIIPANSVTFCTATDGNHGRGVAWAARKQAQSAKIYMPKNTVRARIENIRAEGAEVFIVNGSYDDAVEQCTAEAQRNGWQIISDTSWPGYEEIPRWIMAGYLTLFREIDNALPSDEYPDYVFVQGGVGALLAAAVWHYHESSANIRPRIISVEPTSAACLLKSARSPKGEPVRIMKGLDSIMAGLNCGMPSLVAWPFVRDGVDFLMAIPDGFTLQAMRAYYNPCNEDPRIISGESGAAGLGALLALSRISHLPPEWPSLNANTRVLLLNTEGDTDPESFLRAVDLPT